MKTNFYLCCLVAGTFLLLTACSSGDEEPKDNNSLYYFKFKVDGEQKIYNYEPETQINLTAGKYFDQVSQLHIIQLSGSKNIFEPLHNQIVFRLDHTEDFKAGISYSNLATSGSIHLQTLLFSYFDENGQVYIATNNTISPIWEELVIEFEEIGAESMKGDFSGKARAYDSSSGQNLLIGEVEISEGEFRVPRNNE
ncbi:hypothetical protein [Algoriphagus sp. PAP.12]|uniref:hypothetical protein n=1 Tax=Algoriphagus sp. PAP.12 TaxID=2996678 RepID=UPI00227B96EF|nr:hypothetical protein [Algoriphagus sp. PAP.12]